MKDHSHHTHQANRSRAGVFGALAALFLIATPTWANNLPGEGPRLGTVRTTQAEIESGTLSLTDIRLAGMKMFTTPFNKADGYGDGVMDPNADPRGLGNRPTINGTFLRVNGLDGQSCLECHSVIDMGTTPPTLGIGGAGGSVTNAMFMPDLIDLQFPEINANGEGITPYTGRFINPPALHGAGAVELLSQEMNAELAAIAGAAKANPGVSMALIAKGISFGSISSPDGISLDTSAVEGVGSDLVIKPFGRKGEAPTVRAFDTDALQFHFGMQPVEVVGTDVDADGDGVANEILVGELSAMHVFGTTLKKPIEEPQTAQTRQGRALFNSIGCSRCHTPSLDTEQTVLEYRLPGEATPYYAVDLATDVPGYTQNGNGGLTVPLYSDLKRHSLGPAMADTMNTLGQFNEMFITPRLWGIGSTGPYMHSGQATTIGEAINMHGGANSEALNEQLAWAALTHDEQASILAFLLTQRLPVDAVDDLLSAGSTGGQKAKAKGKGN
ncbi:MAG: di-heme oxidoredictase family protein [Leptospirillia bacterium]